MHFVSARAPPQRLSQAVRVRSAANLCCQRRRLARCRSKERWAAKSEWSHQGATRSGAPETQRPGVSKGGTFLLEDPPRRSRRTQCEMQQLMWRQSVLRVRSPVEVLVFG